MLLASDIPQESNLMELLLWRATHQPEKIAYLFLKDGEEVSNKLTYQDLDFKAKAIAVKLQYLGMTGERALLLYNPGLEFILAFFGCLYAQVIPVPLYPPRRNQNLSRLQNVIRNAQAKLALTTSSILTNIETHLVETPELLSLIWLTSNQTEGISDLRYFGDDEYLKHKLSDLQEYMTKRELEKLISQWHKPQIEADSLAFLQYTSGSTGKPKGVMVSQQNLLVNSRDIDLGLGYDADSISLSWLPTFHDMGLIGGVIHPLYRGIPCYLMEPVVFLQSPVRWLQAISRYGATHSGGPDFAYELCYRKIRDEQKEQLDLSNWQMAFNGSEPVRHEVMENFARAFAGCGFNPSIICPGYGLAEATLKVTGVRKKDHYKLIRVKNSVLQMNKVALASELDPDSLTIVGCGQTEIDTEIKIVNLNTLRECSADEVGEIWVTGKTVAQGYWSNPEQTEATFQAHLADTQEPYFLRTGDLGFMRDGELFVTGRLKDTIIIRGKNHYPQDLEMTVENSHEAIVFHHCAAFTLKIDNKEQLIIVSEVERRYRIRQQKSTTELEGQERRQEEVEQFFAPDLTNKPVFQEIVSSIRENVAKNHGLQVDRVVLIRFGTIPKTSSGKIQRHACQNAFLARTLNIIYES
jgi:acyl-CoA synthetase (AMP-forming)/AMP-acid ligase II